MSASSLTRRSFDPLADPGYVPEIVISDVRDAVTDERGVSVRRHDHNGSDSPRVDLSNIMGMIEIVTAVPTLIPKSFWDSVKLYSNGGTRRVYFYVTDSAGSGAWRYCALV